MSITQKIYAVLENIEQQTNLLRSSGVSDNSPIATIYVPSIRENIRIARLELAEKPANLLTHLCSLTVAERETILRVAEIVAVTSERRHWHDAEMHVVYACALVEVVEQKLRETKAP